MIRYDIFEGGKNEIASKVCELYNDEKIDVINIIYSTIYDDVFSIEAVHHAIVYYKEKTAV